MAPALYIGCDAVQAGTELRTSEQMQLFAVIRTRGAAWQPALSLEGQQAWASHARFMNALEARHVVVLGGPLDGTPDVLLVMRAHSREEIMGFLDNDPWTSLGLLRVKDVMRWTLRLGALP
jgi:hypothetical protein